MKDSSSRKRNSPSGEGSTATSGDESGHAVTETSFAATEVVARATISIVIPTLGNADRLGPTLAAVLCELDARGSRRDEVVVIDDSGAERAEGIVAEILAADEQHASAVRVVATPKNSGLAAAVRQGASTARGDIMVVLHDDVVLAEGALARLVDAMDDASIFAAAPVVAPPGGVAETSAILALADDRFVVREGADEELERQGSAGDAARGLREITFVPSSAFAVRRHAFREMGGFDSLFAPFSFEDVDLSIVARRKGLRLVEVGAARASHGAPPSEGFDGELPSAASYWDGVPKELVDAVIERNRLLLRWKHLQSRTEAHDHLVGLWRRVVEAGLGGDRETLQNVCLAFAKLPEVTRSRRAPSA